MAKTLKPSKYGRSREGSYEYSRHSEKMDKIGGESLFKKKKKLKNKKKLGSGSSGGKWVTMGGKHIFIPS